MLEEYEYCHNDDFWILLLKINCPEEWNEAHSATDAWFLP